MYKKEVLEEIIKCLEHLIANIGEKTTEYHWREFSLLEYKLIENFPEYDLGNVITQYYDNLISINDGKTLSTHREN